jgi:arsenite methyltransferase
VDAPLALFGIGCSVLGGVGWTIGFSYSPGFTWVWIPVLVTLLMLWSFVMFLHATRRGKFLVWSRLLDELGLRGDERLLDLGCGRGAVLLMAAQRLDSGRVAGVDLWRGVDQSGNAEDTTWRNARAEGVADRVELRTADITALPFDDAGFDMVLSSLAIHNIKGKSARAAAVDEAIRVLRPGGSL